MNLSNLKPAEGSVKKGKRVGRGIGSGKGRTSTRGHKGAKSRSGYSQKLGFEGGQMPLQRRVPKFGFKSPNRTEYQAINLSTLDELAGKLGVEVLSLEDIKSNGLASKNSLVKVLAKGELTKKLEVSANAFSKSAIEAIEKQGGKATIV